MTLFLPRLIQLLAAALFALTAGFAPLTAGTVDPAAAAGSLRLPEGNNGPAVRRPGLSGWKGALAQPRAGLILAAGSVPQASFAIVRLPADKRFQGGAGAGIFGTSGRGAGAWRMSYGYEGTAAVFNPGRFAFVQRGDSGDTAQLTSAPWTEDGALVVAWTGGDGTWRLDWYSLTDGSRHEGAPVTAALAPAGDSGLFNIGSTGSLTEYRANGDNGSGQDLRLPWPGEIETIGYVAGSTPSAAD